MKIGIIKYNCKECDKKVMLHYIPCIQVNTSRLFAEIFDNKLCFNCHCDSKIEKLVECVMD